MRLRMQYARPLCIQLIGLLERRTQHAAGTIYASLVLFDCERVVVLIGIQIIPIATVNFDQ